jgi:hypothetical protein
MYILLALLACAVVAVLTVIGMLHLLSYLLHPSAYEHDGPLGDDPGAQPRPIPTDKETP